MPDPIALTWILASTLPVPATLFIVLCVRVARRRLSGRLEEEVRSATASKAAPLAWSPDISEEAQADEPGNGGAVVPVRENLGLNLESLGKRPSPLRPIFPPAWITVNEDLFIAYTGTADSSSHIGSLGFRQSGSFIRAQSSSHEELTDQTDISYHQTQMSILPHGDQSYDSSIERITRDTDSPTLALTDTASVRSFNTSLPAYLSRSQSTASTHTGETSHPPPSYHSRWSTSAIDSRTMRRSLPYLPPVPPLP